MKSFRLVILLLFTALAVVSAAEQKADPKDAKKPLDDAQVNAIVESVMKSNLEGKTVDDIKTMIKEEIKKEQAKTRPNVYHHVHKSVYDAEDVKVENYVAADAVKLGQKKGIFAMKHEINSLEDDEEKKGKLVKPLDPETRQLQEKYEKMLKKILQENEEANKPKPSTLELITEVEKRMKDKQKTKPVKTSDRMIAYMEELLRNLNGGTLKGADRFDMKGFVSSVFGRYRAKHQAEKERKRRIVALKEHLAREGRFMQHQPNFFDEFYVPHENGYDPQFNLLKRPAFVDPNAQPVLQSSVLKHPSKLTLAEGDKAKYLGFEHHSDHEHLPLNMPLVAPDTRASDFLESIGLDDTEITTTADQGFLKRIVNSVKGIFSKD